MFGMILQEDILCVWVCVTCFLVMLHLLPLVSERSEPALLLFRFFSAQEMNLVSTERAELHRVLHTHVQLPVLPVLHVQHLHLIHVHPPLVVQDVPAEQILKQQRQQTRGKRECQGEVGWDGAGQGKFFTRCYTDVRQELK